MKFPVRVMMVAAVAALLSACQAYATCAVGDTVTSTVTADGPSYDYAFTVFNGCDTGDQQMLTSFYLPYFSDADITDIVVPDGWSYSIDTSDNLFDLAGAGVIEFTSDTPLGYSFTSGFSYTSSYDGVEGPSAMNLTNNEGSYTLFGDPLIPGSPDTIAALEPATTTPEPSSASLLAVALGALALGWGRRLRARGCSAGL